MENNESVTMYSNKKIYKRGKSSIIEINKNITHDKIILTFFGNKSTNFLVHLGLQLRSILSKNEYKILASNTIFEIPDFD